MFYLSSVTAESSQPLPTAFQPLCCSYPLIHEHELSQLPYLITLTSSWKAWSTFNLIFAEASMYTTLSCRASCCPSSCVTCNREQALIPRILNIRVLQAGFYQHTLHVRAKDPAPSNNNCYLGTAVFTLSALYSWEIDFFWEEVTAIDRLTFQEVPLTPGACTQFCISFPSQADISPLLLLKASPSVSIC